MDEITPPRGVQHTKNESYHKIKQLGKFDSVINAHESRFINQPEISVVMPSLILRDCNSALGLDSDVSLPPIFSDYEKKDGTTLANISYTVNTDCWFQKTRNDSLITTIYIKNDGKITKLSKEESAAYFLNRFPNWKD